MGRKIIKLKYEGTCKDCGASLPVGSPARYYGSGKIYGTECHEDKREGKGRRDNRTAYQLRDKSQGAINSHHDKHGIYAADGTKMGIN